jgi:MFS family permease
MALYMAIFMGGTPVGAPVIGWIGDMWGPRWTIGIGTVAVGLSLAAVAVWVARRQNVAVTIQTRRSPKLRIQVAPKAVADATPASAARETAEAMR